MKHWRVAHVLCASILLAGSACAATARRSGSVVGSTGAERLALNELAMMSAALKPLLHEVSRSATVCVEFLGGPQGPMEPPTAFLEQASTYREVVREADCPPTHARMIEPVDSLGRSLEPQRPPGYVDPARFSIGRPHFEQGYAFIYARRRQGMAVTEYGCVVHAYDSAPHGSCIRLRSWVH